MPILIIIGAIVAIGVVSMLLKTGRQTGCINGCLRNLGILANELESGSINRQTFDQRKQRILQTVVDSGAHTDEEWFLSQCMAFHAKGYLTEADIRFLKEMAPTKNLNRRQGGF